MSRRRRAERPVHGLFAEIAKLPDEARRQRFLRRHRHLLRPNFIDRLIKLAGEYHRINVTQALRFAEAAVTIARNTGDKVTLARTLRAKANALYFIGQSRSAVGFHQQALRLFEDLGQMGEVARTLSASIQPLALSGQYDRAFASAERAREIFKELGEERSLARLENNLGNVLHRQDRFPEAFACYQRAYQQLLPFKDAEGVAVALHNMAVCLIGLNDFYRALGTYQHARAVSVEHDMPLLTVQADYNIAYLYYLRGEYSRALEILGTTREACQAHGDSYHAALCNLDQSEIYLELNLIDEAAEMARESFAQFQQLGMGYEAAKALTNLAIAMTHQNDIERALELFGQARGIFIREKNRIWPALIDLYRAVVLYNEGRFLEARRLSTAALELSRSSILLDKAVLSHLLLARLSLRTDDLEGARLHCATALEKLARLEYPVLNYQAHFLMGQIHGAAGDREKAYGSYQTARQTLETLRSGLRGEELKISFMKNKTEVYESLVQLCLAEDPRHKSTEEAFAYMEQAKSRSLRELISGRVHPLPARGAGQSEPARRVRDLREQLNWYYHRIELEQVRSEELSSKRIEQLQAQARACENELQQMLRDLTSSEPEYAALHTPRTLTLEEIRAALNPDMALIEYFRVGEHIVGAVLTRENLEVFPLTRVSRATSSLRMLHFQLSKFRLGPKYVTDFQETLLRATQAHLRELYDEIVAPLRHRLRAGHLVFVPHDVLHYLPFHALFDGRRYLIDSFTISYAPSASIYALCNRKPVNPAGSCLILGVPDPQAPFILREVQSVASILPTPDLFLGSEATVAVLRERGLLSRIVHIATHGYFRQDNPMFSGIRLGDSYLSLYDLYQLNLPVELVTLSGCATGLNVVGAGDELLGLVRGLLYAGAQSLLLTMWDVHDRSTAEFMKAFYGRMREHGGKARALKEAMQEVREQYPHPYYWAPFTLLGKAFET